MLKKLNRATTGSTHQHPVKVVQFGEGNFLRAFVDWMVDVMNEKTNFNGSVQIIQPLANGLGELINNQDGLYHVVLNGIQNGKAITETRLITSVTGVINPYEDYSVFLKVSENPDLEFIVSNTTEAGIAFDSSDQSIDNLPKSFPGKLTALLEHRFQFFKGQHDKALTIIPCELIDKNGDELRKTILQYAEHWQLSSAFKQWITEHTTFCNTLVDRIVPGYPRETINTIQDQTGFEDKLVVMAEPFHLWVIEGPAALKDKFPADKAGLDVKFVTDQSPYRTRKVRILNGAHTAMVPVAYLHGLRTVQESVENNFTGEFIRAVIYEEIIPTLDLPKEELDDFAASVLERFKNPFIRHELASIALNSISKFKVRVLPSLLQYIERTGKIPNRLAYSFAAMIRFYNGSWKGVELPVKDTPEVLGHFAKAWNQSTLEKTVNRILSNISLWDMDLSTIDGLGSTISKYLAEIDKAEKKDEALTIL
ncbi:MAG TPA: tagaturonate reductase [Cyclobacteriaceae bacterium]|nr:tagaturonate reductase [Cyclobacteriaceae bacterium]HRJ83467.1 tagaturonate reductase [Cyclobacteriaceae bacterium]